jgi:hypothetical protein
MRKSEYHQQMHQCADGRRSDYCKSLQRWLSIIAGMPDTADGLVGEFLLSLAQACMHQQALQQLWLSTLRSHDSAAILAPHLQHTCWVESELFELCRQCMGHEIADEMQSLCTLSAGNYYNPNNPNRVNNNANNHSSTTKLPQPTTPTHTNPPTLLHKRRHVALLTSTPPPPTLAAPVVINNIDNDDCSTVEGEVRSITAPTLPTTLRATYNNKRQRTMQARVLGAVTHFPKLVPLPPKRSVHAAEHLDVSIDSTKQESQESQELVMHQQATPPATTTTTTSTSSSSPLAPSQSTLFVDDADEEVLFI